MKPGCIPLPVFITIIAAWTFCGAYDDPDLYFFYQRSAYLENCIVPGSWWANPASIAEVDEKTLLTVNASPVAGRFSITSVRFLSPIKPPFALGAGIIGAGEEQSAGSFTATESGATYSSRFIFTRPSFQLGGSLATRRAGNAGVLVSVGADRYSVSSDETENFLTIGIGLGWLSPYLAGNIGMSASVYLVRHFVRSPYWDTDARLGIRCVFIDSTIVGSLEYTFNIREPFRFATSRSPWNHEILKALLSLRIYYVFGALLGFSTDFTWKENMTDVSGTLVHAGLEIFKSTLYRFFGGYEVGVSTDGDWRVTHRFWLGYGFSAHDGKSQN